MCNIYYREINNKDTGIDISVPSFKETKGLLQSTFDYNVVVVSRLQFFKSAKHKETDVVQFTVRAVPELNAWEGQTAHNPTTHTQILLKHPSTN